MKTEKKYVEEEIQEKLEQAYCKSIDEAEESAIIADNIRFYSEKTGKPRTEICKDIGISYPAYSDLLHGRILPRTETLVRIANYFGCTLADLIMPWQEKEKRLLKEKEKSSAVEIPVLGSLNNSDVIGTVYASSKNITNGATYFALRQTGDSMSPRIDNGDIIIVKKTQDVKPGDYVIVSLSGDIACKRYETDADQNIILMPINSDYSPMPINKELMDTGAVKVVGKAVEVRGVL